MSVSCDLTISCGVPQGTKLGPVLFLILVNDMLNDYNARWKYVDDLSILEVRKLNKISNIQTQIDALNSWCTQNDMKLNPDKSCVLNISFAKQHANFPDLHINDSILKSVDHMKILGLDIQSDLKWGNSVSDMVSRGSRRMYILCRLKKCNFSISDLSYIYCAYIRPVLEYATPVWTSSLTDQQSNDLERVQKRACRIILGGYDSYTYALQTLNIISLADRRNELLEAFSLKLMTSLRHRDFLPQPRSVVTRRQLRNSTTLDFPLCRTSRYYNSAIPAIIRSVNVHLSTK